MHLDIKTVDRICLVTVVLVFLASGYWVVSRGLRQLGEIRKQNDFLAKSLKDLALAETNLQRLNVAIDETKKQIKALDERIPDTAKIGQFLKQLDALMKERQIVLESFEPLPTVEQKRFTRIPIRLISRGSFVNIYRLISDLETMSRLVDVEDTILTSVNEGGECRFDLTTSIFER
jgi:Tfp pilus assembly protein PilO